MRGYMYAYGYWSLSRAREALEHAGLLALPCKERGAGPVRCALGFDLRAKAIGLFRLMDQPMGLPV